MSELTVEQEIAAKFRGETLPEAPAPEAETAETVVEEPPVDPPVEEPPAEPEPPLLAGKYKTVEELERAYTEAQTAIGRQGNELSELRTLKTEFQALRDQLTQPASQYDAGTIQEFLDTNPAQIPAVAQQALNTGDTLTYQAAMRAWGEHDSVGAMDFHARQVTANAVNELRAEMAPVRETTERNQTAQEFANAYQSKQAEHPDFDAVMNSVTEQQIAGFPKTVIQALGSGDQEVKAEVLETLYRWTKAEQAGTLTQAAAETVATQAAEAAAQRLDATVASTTASSDRVQVVKTPQDAFHEAFENSPAFRKAAGLA